MSWFVSTPNEVSAATDQDWGFDANLQNVSVACVSFCIGADE